MPHDPALTGDPSKKQQLKTNFALIAGVGVLAFVALGYVLVRHRAVLAQGAGAVASQLGPIVSRVLPAIVLGILSLIFGPEALLLSVPAGLLVGPELLSLLGGGSTKGKGSESKDSNGTSDAVNALATQAVLTRTATAAAEAA